METKMPRRDCRRPGLADWLEPTCPILSPVRGANPHPVRQVYELFTASLAGRVTTRSAGGRSGHQRPTESRVLGAAKRLVRQLDIRTAAHAVTSGRGRGKTGSCRAAGAVSSRVFSSRTIAIDVAGICGFAERMGFRSTSTNAWRLINTASVHRAAKSPIPLLMSITTIRRAQFGPYCVTDATEGSAFSGTTRIGFAKQRPTWSASPDPQRRTR
jgi:hypothetical protein